MLNVEQGFGYFSWGMRKINRMINIIYLKLKIICKILLIVEKLFLNDSRIYVYYFENKDFIESSKIFFLHSFKQIKY